MNRKSKLYIEFYHHSKRHRKSLGLDDTPENRKFAEKQLIPELIYKINNGVLFENAIEMPTLAEFAPTSFEIRSTSRRQLTHQSYMRTYELHIRPKFGNKKLDAIKPSMLSKWQNDLLTTRSGKTVKVIRTVFSCILEDAMFDELIETNPFKRVKMPKIEEVREKNPFSMNEMFLIIDKMPILMQAFFAIGFFTGMRTGEIIGLQWRDIDWDNRIIQVRRSRRQGVETEPKTKNSIRDIDILDALWPYLVQHKDHTDPQHYVFETYMGEPYNTCDKIAAHYWQPALKELGLKYRNLYQMRHSFASLMISSGEDILWVSNMLGHKDSSLTLEKYARYVKSNDKKRAQFLVKSDVT